MKKLFTTVVAAFLTLCVCNAQNGYRIEGSISNYSEGKMCLVSRGDTLARAELKGGRFEMTGKVDEPTLAYIYVEGESKPAPVFLENTNFTVEIDLDAVYSGKIEGGYEQSLFSAFNAIDMGIIRKRGDLNTRLQQATSQAEADSIQIILLGLMREQQDEENELIRANPDASASAQLITKFMNIYNLNFVKLRYGLLSDKAKATRYGKLVGQHIEARERTEIGVVAPDFTLTDADGNTFRMSDVKAKVKVLMFWKPSDSRYSDASRLVLRTYEKFHDKGMEVISISREDGYDDWVGVVRKDGFPWKQGFDWKDGYSQAMYLYGGYDQNGARLRYLYVLDENNKILYINVSQKDIQQCMESLLD